MADMEQLKKDYAGLTVELPEGHIWAGGDEKTRAGVLFFNTLFDENASCHMAFGEAYPSCLAGAENMSEEELAERGVNKSMMHEDFMIGSPDLEITGITHDGKEVAVFRNGNFAF